MLSASISVVGDLPFIMNGNQEYLKCVGNSVLKFGEDAFRSSKNHRTAKMLCHKIIYIQKTILLLYTLLQRMGIK